MREVCEISMQEIADNLDVPVETYTKDESGEIDILQVFFMKLQLYSM